MAANPINSRAGFPTDCPAHLLGETMQRDPWTADDIARLRELRAQGLMNEEIAEQMHRSKISVANKATRLHIPSAYVPIAPKRGVRTTPRSAIKRAGKTTLPPLPSLHENP